MKLSSKEEMLQDIYEEELRYWSKMVRDNPRYAALKLALMTFDEFTKTMTDKTLETRWRKAKYGEDNV